MDRRLATLGTLALVVAACSPAPVVSPSVGAPVATSTVDVTSPTPTPGASGPAVTPVQDGTPVPSGAGSTGQLVVTQASVADLPGVFTEGAVAFVEVYDAAGTLVANARNGDYLGAIELLRTDLPAGRYELRTYVRPCSGACPGMDPPTDECRLEVVIEPAGEVAVRVVRSVGVPCRAGIAPG